MGALTPTVDAEEREGIDGSENRDPAHRRDGCGRFGRTFLGRLREW